MSHVCLSYYSHRKRLFKRIKTDKNNEILINCSKGEIYQHLVAYTYTHDMRLFYNILCNRE
jgi:hypothetical protein